MYRAVNSNGSGLVLPCIRVEAVGYRICGPERTHFAGTGIRVNLVSPGLILTPEVKASFMERARKDNLGDRWEDVEPHVAADIPIRRIPRREEIADFVVFLASDRADAIHGQNLRIDGGALGTLT